MMIWSEKELAYMPLAGEKVIMDQFMANIGRSENEDIFLPQNFSLLWGILGVVGLAGTDAVVRTKIWRALEAGGALNAFKFGILADFTKQLRNIFRDCRFRAWENLDNYEANTKFCRLILDELITSNPDLCADIFNLGYQPWKILERLDKNELSLSLKVYLEQIRKQPPSDDFERAEYYLCYKKFLQKLISIIGYTKRELTEAEKKYFCFCFQDILGNGFNRHDIGATDHFWSKLMLHKNIDLLSEIEYAALRAYNQDIMDYIFSFEDDDGFYEECAAISIYGDPRRYSVLLERCFYLAKKTNEPRGVVYAKALMNIGKIRSAVILLQTLAKYGKATMMVCYLDTLLFLAKGVENVLLQILRANLFAVRNNSVNYINTGYREYIARLYLQAVRIFVNNEKYAQAASLLQEIVLEQWLGDSEDLKSDFIAIANKILLQDEQTRSGLISVAKKLNLKDFYNGNICYIGFDKDNPLTKKRQQVENTIKDATTIDVSQVTNKLSSVETSVYHHISEFKGLAAFLKGKAKSEDEKKQDDVDVSGVGEKKVAVPDIGEKQVEVPDIDEKEAVASRQVSEVNDFAISLENNEKSAQEEKGNVLSVSDIDSSIIDNKNNLLDIDSKEIDEHFEQIKQTADAAIQEQSVSSDDVSKHAEIVGPSEVKTADSEIDIWQFDDEEEKNDNKHKISINSILNINPDEIDKHFEQIKNLADSTVKKLSKKAVQLKDDIAEKQPLTKIKQLTSKIKFPHKK